MSIQSWFNHVWYERPRPPVWLIPLASAYGAVVEFRRDRYRREPDAAKSLSCPVIVVGNLSVGGTGKTPLVLWLVAALAKLGFAPGIVSRGYRGEIRGTHLLRGIDTAALVGDEALLLSRRSAVPVAVGRDRPAAAQLLIDAGCNVIVSDDGLQHYALARQCEIVVVDGQRRFGNGRLLPAGPLREPTQRLQQADAVVVNGGPFAAEGIHMRLRGGQAVSLLTNAQKPLTDFTGSRVHGVAGIGNPQRFFGMLRGYGIEVTEHALPDHAALRRGDIWFPDELPVLMTEKDAVKCMQSAGPQHWSVPVTAEFDPEEGARLLNIVERAIKSRAP